MGQIIKQVSPHSTRYYWYPGDKKEYLRGAAAVGAGAAAFGLLRWLTRDTLLAAVVGTSITAAMAGLNFGRRDSRELARFGDIAQKSARRQAVAHTGRAAWRGLAEGTGGAAAAIIIVNLANHGVLADWLLPLVPAAVGALAHQIGMMYERLGTSKSVAGPASKSVAGPASAAARVPVDAAMRKPNKAGRPPMPASLALLEMAEAHRAELAQAAKDAAGAHATRTNERSFSARVRRTGRHAAPEPALIE
jgi:hypothetical protein